MSSGASSYSQTQRATQRYDAMQEVPLYVAGSGVIDTRTPGSSTELSVFGSKPSAPGTAPVQPTALVEPGTEGLGGPEIVTGATGPVEIADLVNSPESAALSPQVRALRNRTEARFAALSPLGARPVSLAGHDALPEDFVNPEELAAERRIPALYASIKHGRCKRGWGPKPRMVNASRIIPGDPYYMEMRMRHTPLLPVGHVYIAYGRLGPDGEPLDERLVMLSPLGGYVGAGVAGAVPMPGILEPVGDDCIIRPEAAYRVSLSAVRYENLLLAIREQKKRKPTYHLFAYNCNHFMSEVASSVGILPPRNIYKPSLIYFYEMMDRNEGHKVPRTWAALFASRR